MKWQFGRSESAHRSCPTCGGTGFVEDEPIIRPQGDTDAGWERNAQGHWTQASSHNRYTFNDDIPLREGSTKPEDYDL